MTVAIFSSANESYVPKAVAALLSFRRWHPELGYYLLGSRRGFGDWTLDFLRANAIELIDVDEAGSLPRAEGMRGSHELPVETFYLLKGPELMAQRGYDYSVSIDGDVFCRHRLALRSLLPGHAGLAGRVLRPLSETIRENREDSRLSFDLSEENLRATFGKRYVDLGRRVEIHGGFVVWNNGQMSALRLFDQVKHFSRRFNGAFKGNQDLFAFISAYLDIRFAELDRNDHFILDYNTLRNQGDEQLRVKDVLLEDPGDPGVIHFVHPKPWLVTEPIRPAHWPLLNGWRRFVASTFPGDPTALFGDLHDIDDDWDPLDRQVFPCVGREMWGAIPCREDAEGRVAVGEAGHLVHGPYIRIQREGRYRAELRYRTRAGGTRRAGEFDITASLSGAFRTLGRTELPPTDGELSSALVAFDTTGAAGMSLETRVYVDEGVEMKALQIRLARSAPAST